jgi:hypothetical protein
MLFWKLAKMTFFNFFWFWAKTTIKSRLWYILELIYTKQTIWNPSVKEILKSEQNSRSYDFLKKNSSKFFKKLYLLLKFVSASLPKMSCIINMMYNTAATTLNTSFSFLSKICYFENSSKWHFLTFFGFELRQPLNLDYGIF